MAPKEDEYTNTPITSTKPTTSATPYLETTPKITEYQETNIPIALTQEVAPESMSTPMIEQLTSAQPGINVPGISGTTLQTSGRLYKTAFDTTIHYRSIMFF